MSPSHAGTRGMTGTTFGEEIKFGLQSSAHPLHRFIMAIIRSCVRDQGMHVNRGSGHEDQDDAGGRQMLETVTRIE